MAFGAAYSCRATPSTKQETSEKPDPDAPCEMNGPNYSIEVVPATVDRQDLMAALFATSKGVSDCWCMWPLRHPRTHRPDPEVNKADMIRRLKAGQSLGLLALHRGKAVGWCALGPRDRYPQYIESAKQEHIWAIPCIYIERAAGRRLVARALIEAAISVARKNGATSIDGPPPWWLPGDAGAIAEATGTFLENGFEQLGPGARMPELRLRLGSV